VKWKPISPLDGLLILVGVTWVAMGLTLAGVSLSRSRTFGHFLNEAIGPAVQTAIGLTLFALGVLVRWRRTRNHFTGTDVRPWTEQEDEWVRSFADAEAARRTGRPIDAVCQRRTQLQDRDRASGQ
jgi:hypothetical protein